MLDRDMSSRQMRGRGANDTFEDGQRVLLHVDHIVSIEEGGTDIDSAFPFRPRY